MTGLNPLIITSMALSAVSLAKNKNFIKENWKPIIAIGATMGLTYGVWSIYQDFKWKTNPTKVELKEDPRYKKTKLTEAQALMKANRLQEAMGTFGKVNEKELNAIRSILTDLTYNDYVKVSKAFGNRGYVTITGISKDSDWITPSKNLSYWLSKELQPQDLNALKQVIPNVF